MVHVQEASCLLGFNTCPVTFRSPELLQPLLAASSIGMHSSTHKRLVLISTKTSGHPPCCVIFTCAGPLAYNSIGHLGKQELSEWETAPGWKLGTGSRFGNVEERRAAEVPGPGQYAVPRAFGPQVASNKRSLPVVGFGKAGAKLARPQVRLLAPRGLHARLPDLTNMHSKVGQFASNRQHGRYWCPYHAILSHCPTSPRLIYSLAHPSRRQIIVTCWLLHDHSARPAGNARHASCL